MNRPSRTRYLVVALIATGAISLYITRHVFAVTNELIQDDLLIGSTAMGRVMGLFSLGYLLFQVPGGWLGNKLGARAGLAALSVVWSLLTLATAFVHSLLPLEIVRFLFGAAQAGFVPITAKIIKDWFPEKQLGITSAFVGISMSVGGALAMDVTGRLSNQFDWRVIFQMYSLVGIFWSLVFVLLFRTKPRAHPWANAAECELIEQGQPPGSDAQNPSEPFFTRRNLKILLLSTTLWAIGLQAFFRAAGYNFFVTFFPEYLSRKFDGINAGDAGLYTKWPLIGVVIGGLLGGLLIDRIFTRTGNKWLSRSAVAMAALGITAVFTYLSFKAENVVSFVTLIAIGAAFSGAGSPAAWAATIDVGGKHTATVSALMNMAGNLSGVLVTPILGGMMDILKGIQTEVVVFSLNFSSFGWTNTRLELRLTDQLITDWSQVIYMHAGFYLAGALCWLAIRPQKNLFPDQHTAYTS